MNDQSMPTHNQSKAIANPLQNARHSNLTNMEYYADSEMILEHETASQLCCCIALLTIFHWLFVTCHFEKKSMN